MSAMELAASVHAAAAAKGIDIAAPAANVAITKDASESNVQALAYVSKAVFNLARAHQNGDVAAKTAKLQQLKNFIARQYSMLDLLGWMQCVRRYLEYYVTAHRMPPYVDWQAQSPPDINLGVLEYQLPKGARILLLGELGHIHDGQRRDIARRPMDVQTRRHYPSRQRLLFRHRVRMPAERYSGTRRACRRTQNQAPTVLHHSR
jgi:hypothetical protein